MFPEKEWAAVHARQSKAGAAFAAGLVRLTLLFGSAALAVAFFIAPLKGDPEFGRIDVMTASFIGDDSSRILHRDGIGRSAASICVIRANDTRAGNC